MKNTGIEAIIGLETHVRLNTGGKIFCECSLPSNTLEIEPNSHICPICIGHPGTLPHFQFKVLVYAVAFALAMGAKNDDLVHKSFFERKHYFFWDLPKNYQITQNKNPFCRSFYQEVPREKDGSFFTVRIHHIHLEEDAAKKNEDDTLKVDFNRSGAVLAEIVTDIVKENNIDGISSPDDAKDFLRHLQRLLRWHNLSTGNPQAGDFRCDVNVSVRRFNAELNPKTELKNIAGFDGVKEALKVEITRLSNILVSGGVFEQETRNWDSEIQKSTPSRIKESAKDYWYYIEPDLLNLIIDKNTIQQANNMLKEDLVATIKDLLNAKFPPFEVFGSILNDPWLARLVHHSINLGVNFKRYRPLIDFFHAVSYSVDSHEREKGPCKSMWDIVSKITVDTIIELALLKEITPDQMKVIIGTVPWIKGNFQNKKDLFNECGIKIIETDEFMELVLKLLEKVLCAYPDQTNKWLTQDDDRVANFIQGQIMSGLQKGSDGKLVRQVILKYKQDHKASGE